MELPYQPDLPVNLLAACFNKTSATYKFYWFLAILSKVESGVVTINKKDLFIEMIAHSWFTVNYFHVSFGKQDKLQHAIETIKGIEGLTIDLNRDKIITQLSQSNSRETGRQLNYFNSEVPHRFLSPWFKAEDMSLAYKQSQSFTNNCPYALYKEHIEINPSWVSYLQSNSRILKDFCYWNLSTYLQTKNPNVPDIPNKLIKLPVRKALNSQRKHYWDIVIGELGKVDCIYTNKALQVGNYAVEHFVPYAFVSHDLIWNLIPADRSFNSTKSDRLPLLNTHFDRFFTLQQTAVEIIQHKLPNNKFLEEYLSIFPNLNPIYFNRDKFFEHIQPLVTIASNNGFQYLHI
ncbi:HNH endonuclease domain-containing protein [Mucilaginibacter calamicampi]|uniref:HNH endonuclease domain-containing protein n=1 Tax=Mucilaginibacter calamicampi TaxID=1302352 RepID=A0ABW2YZS9_9SPHI